MRRLLALFVFAVLLFVPTLVRAELTVATDRHHEREARSRKGFMMGLSTAPGIVLVPRGFVPTTRVRYVLGGGITDRFTLGAEMGATFHLGLDKSASFDTDVVATGFVGRGFALRAGLGGSSRVVSREGRLFRPGVGGLVGVGYEFGLLERGGLRLGVDYDVEVRTDGRTAQAVFLALELRGYLHKKR